MPRLERSGMTIHYEVFRGSGPPLVLLHGMMGTSDTWRIEGYLDALLGDFRVITLDLRGHGQSSISHDPAAYTLAEFVADVIGVLDAAAADSAYLCGFSLGADIALAVAGRHPNRVAGIVTLGLSSCNQGFEDVPWYGPREDSIELFATEGMAWATRDCQEQGRPAWSTMLGQADPQAMIAIERASELDGPIPGLRLHDLTVPLVCVWGEKETQPRNASLPDHAQLVEIPDADHVGVVEHRDVIVELLRSLALSASVAH